MNNHYFLLTIFLCVLTILVTTGYTDITPVSDRTIAVRDAIVAALADVDNAADVTETYLGTITSLNLRNKGITELKSGDFSGLTALTSLNLHNNQLSSLPDGVFKGLKALISLRLGQNTVSLETGGTGEMKAVAPTGAPFDIVVPS